MSSATLSKPSSQSIGRLRPAPAKAAKVVKAATELTVDQLGNIFTGTGITAPSEIGLDSTDHIPASQDLEGWLEQDAAGKDIFAVYRQMRNKADRRQVDESILVAYATNPEEGAEAFPEFKRVYGGSSYADRAFLLGNKEWVEHQRLLIGQAVGRIGTTNSSGGSYKSKIVMEATTANNSVMVGESDAGKKRLTWNGHSGFSLARYLGANGWTGGEAVATYEKIGLPMGKTAIVGGVYAGKAGKRGEPAKVTSTQHQILNSILIDIRAAAQESAKAKSEAAQAKELAKLDQTPADPRVIRKAAPAKAAPAEPDMKPGKATNPALPDRPAKVVELTRGEKLAKLMAMKAADKKANKAAATAKGQATKAANKAKA